MITRAHVMPYMGQRVVVRTNDGVIHHGVLHSVSDDGIYLRQLQGGVRMVNASTKEPAALLTDLKQSDQDLEEVFFPFLFFPWWGIGGFWPWGWWW